MKITVTREHIKRAKYADIYGCVCALAISERLGTKVSVGTVSGHIWDGCILFTIDKKGQRFATRCLVLPKWMQWTGSFKITLLGSSISEVLMPEPELVQI